MSGFMDDTFDQPSGPDIESGDGVNFTFGGAAPSGAAGGSDFEAIVRLARDRDRDMGEMRRAAKSIGQAIGSMGIGNNGESRALYAWTQGGSRIEGATIKLIQALAQKWGCMSTSTEFTDRRGNQVELQVTIIDLVSLNINRRPFYFEMAPAPGKYANKPDQKQRWMTMQMQSGISKCVRSALESVLPDWFVQTAIDAAKAVQQERVLTRTDEAGNRRTITLDEAADDATTAYREYFDVDLVTLEGHIGADRSMWTVTDIAGLRALFGKLKRGETTVAAAFPESVRDAGEAKRAERAKPAQKPQSAPRPRKGGLAGIADKRGQTQTIDMDPAEEVEGEPAFDPDTGEVEMSAAERAAIEAEERAAAQAELDMP